MGDSHAIYNPTDQPLQWMNINVTAIKGEYDAFDTGDPRGVTLDAGHTPRSDQSRIPGLLSR